MLYKHTFRIVDNLLHVDHTPVLPASDSLSDNTPSWPDTASSAGCHQLVIRIWPVLHFAVNSIGDVNQLSYLLRMFEIGVGAHLVVPPGLGNL